MAVLALAAVGSAIGGAAITGTVMGMSGAAFGWMAGSMAGSLLFPPKAPDGPRLEDKSVQVSTYGQPIPRVYGTHRLAGNVLWSTDLIETATEEGGKGGPSYTTYSYRASFAVGVCRGPITGIRRIWADGVLIFDQSETNTGEQKGYEAESMAVYTGTESQLPDPTIISIEGEDGAPAYRGQAYVVFTDLQLAKFGNRLPSLTFEVVQSGFYTSPPPLVIGNGNLDGAYDAETGYFWTHNSTKTVYVHDLVSGTQIASFAGSTGGVLENNIKSIAYVGANRSWMQVHPDGCPTHCPRVGVNSGRSFYLGMGKVYFFPGEIDQGGVFVNADAYAITSYAWFSESSVSTLDGAFTTLGAPDLLYIPRTKTGIGESTAVTRGGFGGRPPFSYYDAKLSIIAGTSAESPTRYMIELFGTKLVAGIRSATGGVGSIAGIDVISGDKLLAKYDSPELPSGSEHGLMYDSKRRVLLHTSNAVSGTPLAAMIDLELKTRTVMSAGTDILSSGVYSRTEDAFFVARSNTVVELDPVTLAVRRTIPLGTYNPVRMYNAPETDEYILATTVQNVLLKIFVARRLTSLPVPLSDVVTAESGLVGLPPSDLNVSALTSTMVRGFTVASGGAVRSGIEQLMMAYAFDAVESGGVVKFVKRGGPVVATLADVDLAAHQPGNEVPTPLAITRAEEVELPQRITIRYSNPNADYQAGAQSAQRLTGRAMAQQGVDLPIVLNDSEALQVSEAALYSAWTARTSTTLTTTLRHAALEPTDIVSAGGNVFRITRRMENAGLLTFEAAFENGNVYAQTAVGAEAEGPREQSIQGTSRTSLALLDLPPLRDEDDNAGYYMAASSRTSGRWDGALVFKSADGGVTYEELALISSQSIMGNVIVPPGVWDYRNNEFDRSSTLDVRINSGELSSISELAVLNKGNVALVGTEILQFKNAELLGTNVYRLSGLLRCRRGTRAMFGQHYIGEPFVLLTSSALRRAKSSTAEIGLERIYKPVTIGSRLAATEPVAFTNTARALRPMAPVHVGGGRLSNGGVFVTWTRCNRIGQDWIDWTGGSLDQPEEKYEVEVVADTESGVLHRTETVTTNSFTYTQAMQIADTGSYIVKPWVFRIYQISPQVGRGDRAEAQIPEQLFI